MKADTDMARFDIVVSQCDDFDDVTAGAMDVLEAVGFNMFDADEMLEQPPAGFGAPDLCWMTSATSQDVVSALITCLGCRGLEIRVATAVPFKYAEREHVRDLVVAAAKADC